MQERKKIVTITYKYQKETCEKMEVANDEIKSLIKLVNLDIVRPMTI